MSMHDNRAQQNSSWASATNASRKIEVTLRKKLLDMGQRAKARRMITMTRRCQLLGMGVRDEGDQNDHRDAALPASSRKASRPVAVTRHCQPMGMGLRDEGEQNDRRDAALGLGPRTKASRMITVTLGRQLFGRGVRDESEHNEHSDAALPAPRGDTFARIINQCQQEFPEIHKASYLKNSIKQL